MGQAASAALHSSDKLRFPAPELAVFELAVLDLLRQLDSANGDSRVVESFEPEHRPNSLFDSSVVLFNEVVQVLAGSNSYSLGKFARLLHFSHRAMRCRIGVQRDLRRFAHVLHRTAEESLCGVYIAISAQEEIDSPAYLVHSPIQIDPVSPNLYVCLVHPPRSADWTSVSAPALLEFRQVTLHPTQNRCVRQRDASIPHHDHQVPEAQFETRVPADTEDDDLPVEMSSLEQCFDRNERLHSAIIPDRGLFAPEPLIPGV